MKNTLPEIGQRFINKQGKWAIVIGVDGCKQITLRFDERDYTKTVTADSLHKGVFFLPSIFVGDIFQDKLGNNVTVKAVEKSDKITFEWDDGYTRVCQSSVLRLGTLMREEDSCRLNPKLKIGDRFTTKQGAVLEIIEYKNFRNILICFIEFDKSSRWVSGGNLIKGNTHHPMLPSNAGVGILGTDKVDTKSKAYKTWAGMLKRVYTPKKGLKTYEGCSVCEEWKHYPTFKEWFDLQTVEDEYQLDKDLLCKGNKVYCPEYCVLVPREINTFLTNRRNERGDSPVGTHFKIKNQKWQCSVSLGNGKPTYLGLYDSPVEAFEVYKIYKEDFAKKLAEFWKDRVDSKVYEALMLYEVEITD